MKRVWPPVLILLVMIGVYIGMRSAGFRYLIPPLAGESTGSASSGQFTGTASYNNGRLPDAGKTIKLTYVAGWTDAIATIHVVKDVLQNRLGYNVRLNSVSAALMWKATADGTSDGFLAAWLPTLHHDYYEKYKNRLVDLGPNLNGTKSGLVVPDYVNIQSIDQLNAHAGKFNHQIIGIDPGAGIMSATDKAIKEYNLKLHLVSSSGAAMTAKLGAAIQRHQWIVVTGWNPHWMFARWHLHYLKDPKGVYGKGGYIATFVRRGLAKDQPDAFYVLNQFHWKMSDITKVMAWNEKKGANPNKTAQRWIQENPKKVAAWLPLDAKR